MDFEFVKAVEPDHLRLTVRGAYTFDKVFDFLDFVKSEVETAGLRKVLVDCSGIDGSLTEADRFQGGKRVAEVFGSRIKIAFVMPEGQVTKLGEMAAVNRGAILLVTDSLSEAEDWLLDRKSIEA